MTRRLSGHGASRGSALGHARLRQSSTPDIRERRIEAGAVEAELGRLHAAVEAARGEMHHLRQRLQGALTDEIGEFLDLHALLLDDPELLYGLDELIRTGRYAAEYALRLQRDRLAAVFENMEDAYLRSRLDDLDHVIGRIHAHLQQRGQPRHEGVAGEILVCDTVAPSELAELQASGVAGVVCTAGSTLSHSAILARSLHLPMVVAAADALKKIGNGDVVIVDGLSGEVTIDPDADALRAHRNRVRELARGQRGLGRLRSKPTRSRDGVDISLLANAESPADIARAHALGAAGLGLYRTEFLFLQRDTLPTEDEQFHAYRDAVLGMAGRPVTFRTLDLGADKADRAGLAATGEDNPALGLRGIRLSLAHPRVFDAQLRALLRASGYGPVRILVPMVTSREEILGVRRRIARLAGKLREEGHEIADSVPLGAMIEVPAAAIAVHGLADAMDFMSIGTNDLVQYLLAADRNHEGLGELHSPLHPGVLRLLRHIIAAGDEHGVPVAMCGEMAGDATLAPLLLALGLKEFSLHPANLLELRQAIRDTDLAALQARTPELMKARDRKGIERWLDEARSAAAH